MCCSNLTLGLVNVPVVSQLNRHPIPVATGPCLALLARTYRKRATRRLTSANLLALWPAFWGQNGPQSVCPQRRKLHSPEFTRRQRCYLCEGLLGFSDLVDQLGPVRRPLGSTSCECARLRDALRRAGKQRHHEDTPATSIRDKGYLAPIRGPARVLVEAVTVSGSVQGLTTIDWGNPDVPVAALVGVVREDSGSAPHLETLWRARSPESLAVPQA